MVGTFASARFDYEYIKVQLPDHKDASELNSASTVTCLCIITYERTVNVQTAL